MEEKQNFVKILREVVKDEIQPLKDDIIQFKDEILTSNDKVVSKLDKIEVELTSFHGGQYRQDEEIDKVKIRVKQLENKVGVA